MKKNKILFLSLVSVPIAGTVAFLSASCGNTEVKKWKQDNLSRIDNVLGDTEKNDSVISDQSFDQKQRQNLKKLIDEIKNKKQEIEKSKKAKEELEKEIKKQEEDYKKILKEYDENLKKKSIEEVKTLKEMFFNKAYWDFAKDQKIFNEAKEKEINNLFNDLYTKQILPIVSEIEKGNKVFENHKVLISLITKYKNSINNNLKLVYENFVKNENKILEDLSKKFEIEQIKKELVEEHSSSLKASFDELTAKFKEYLLFIKSNNLITNNENDLSINGESFVKEFTNVINLYHSFLEAMSSSTLTTKIDKAKEIVKKYNEFIDKKESIQSDKLKELFKKFSENTDENQVETLYKEFTLELKNFAASYVLVEQQKTLIKTYLSKIESEKIVELAHKIGYNDKNISEQIDKIKASYKEEKNFVFLISKLNKLNEIYKNVTYVNELNEINEIISNSENKITYIIKKSNHEPVKTLAPDFYAKYLEYTKNKRDVFTPIQKLKEYKNYLLEKLKVILPAVKEKENEEKLYETLDNAKARVNKEVDEQFIVFKNSLKAQYPAKAEIIENNISTLIQAQKNVYTALFRAFKEPLANIHFHPKYFELISDAIHDASILINEITIQVMEAALKTSSQSSGTNFLEDVATPELIQSIKNKAVAFFQKSQAAMTEAFKAIFETFNDNDSLKKDGVTKIKEIVDVSVKYYEEEVPKLVEKIKNQELPHLSLGNFDKLKLELAPYGLMFDNLWKGQYERLYKIYPSGSKEMKAILREFDKSRYPILDAAKSIGSELIGLGQAHREFFNKVSEG